MGFKIEVVFEDSVSQINAGYVADEILKQYKSIQYVKVSEAGICELSVKKEPLKKESNNSDPILMHRAVTKPAQNSSGYSGYNYHKLCDDSQPGYGIGLVWKDEEVTCPTCIGILKDSKFS
jgi:hypothetical protein